MKESEVYTLNLSCVRSYIYYHESKYYKRVVDQLLEHTRYKWEEAVRWFVSNSARAFNSKASGLIISLDKNTYTANKQGIGYRKVKSLIDFLETNSYIDLYRGYVKSWKNNKGKPCPDESLPSCIVFRKRMVELWKGVNTSVDVWRTFEENELAVIRNRETKELMPTRGYKGFKDIKKEVREMNDNLKGADITFEGKPIADVAYRRIFSGGLDKGGRLYTLGGGVQLLPQHVRASSLRIDGERVVELDYSSLHPNICYQRMFNDDGFSVYGVMGSDFSPYGADLSFVTVDNNLKNQWENLTGEEHKPLRSLAKLAILIGMNADNMADAAWTLGDKVRADRSKPIQQQDYYAIVGSVDYSKVLESVRDHNDFIRDSFFNDGGIHIQNIDSKIMMNIVGRMGEKGHTILCYHDSALVKESAKDDLYNAMIQAWKDVLGDTTFCKVEQK